MKPGRTAWWVAGGAGLLLASCAYFNTLYNAKEKYADAQKLDRQQAGAGAGTTTGANALAYEEVIEKCKKMIARYPDSRHVDDAMLLIGRSLYALGRYEEAVSALDSLETRHPKSNLLADTRFLKGKSLASAKHYDAAVPVLSRFVDDYRKHDSRPEALYLLCTSLMQLGLSEDAVAALERLERDHGRSDYRFRAQVDMAEILAEKELYQESLAVYQRLNETRIPEKVRFDVWMGMARVQEEVGDHAGALETLAQVQTGQITPDREPTVLLLRARAHMGADSTARAITEYRDVASRFSRGVYGAEANFHLGEIYEGMDSLRTAQRFYQEVPKSYASSPFAEDAIRRSSDIARVLRLEEMAGDDSPEAMALRTFSMAEIQLFQFNSAEKAIPSYEKIVSDYPDTEFAPKSAYALGYIYGVVLQDSVKAREWYEVLRTRYGGSQQMQLAYAFYKGAAPPPPVPELMRFSQSNAPEPAPATSPVAPPPAASDSTSVGAPADSTFTAAPADTTNAGAPADTTAAPADTTGAAAPPDTTATEPPPGGTAPADTSSAPADTTSGGN
jgi:TolA-binding protein